MPRLLLIIITVLLPGLAKSQGVEFPSPPRGQVLDPSGWLGEDRTLRLEEELGRYRRNHDVDVFVVLWSRSLGSETTLEELALRIGETWSRQSLWAVVLHLPESLYRPVVVTRNTSAKLSGEKPLEVVRQSAVSRGMKEPHTRARMEALALETGEELIFWKNQALRGQNQSKSGIPDDPHPEKQSREKLLPPPIILISLTLLPIVIIRCLRRRFAPLTFPETTWRFRLQAKWSGGSRIIVSIPPRAS